MSADQIDEDAPVVVIGAGQAGFSASRTLRDLGHAGPIVLVGNEEHPPYQRPPLSKSYLLGETTLERLYLRPLDFYRQRSIDLRLSMHVERIERSAREVRLRDGTSLPYARLILATGTRPRRLPALLGGDLAGVHSIRTLADIEAIAGEFRAGRRVLIVGGGYIGLEAAAVSVKLGLRVTLIEAAPRILGRVACAETAARFRTLHRAHGVDLREGVGIATLNGAGGRVASATLTDGSQLPLHFALVGIGVDANDELAAAAGLRTDNGICVDTHCRTSDPLILAAGDCAVFPWRGRQIRLESVGHATDHGEAAARAVMGQSQGYVAKPWFWSDQFDVKLQIAGLSAGYDGVATRQGSGAGVSFWYYRGNELLAVDALNDPRAYMAARRMIENRRSPPRDLVCDPATDLKSLAEAGGGRA